MDIRACACVFCSNLFTYLYVWCVSVSLFCAAWFCNSNHCPTYRLYVVFKLIIHGKMLACLSPIHLSKWIDWLRKINQRPSKCLTKGHLSANHPMYSCGMHTDTPSHQLVVKSLIWINVKRNWNMVITECSWTTPTGRVHHEHLHQLGWR